MVSLELEMVVVGAVVLVRLAARRCDCDGPAAHDVSEETSLLCDQAWEMELGVVGVAFVGSNSHAAAGVSERCQQQRTGQSQE